MVLRPIAVKEPPRRLVLPKRYEVLARESDRHNINLSSIVERVDEAAERLDRIIGHVNSSGIGRLEFFLGLSGSGKTTFFHTLSNFFDVSGEPLSSRVKLKNIAKEISRSYFRDKRPRIFFLSDRDNPVESKEVAAQFFEDLRRLFREEQGKVVIGWPITDKRKAREFAQVAWDIGRDSIVDTETKGIFHFKGLPKSKFYETADNTCRSLSGDGLDSFGIDRDDAKPLIRKADTIGFFYELLEKRSSDINKETFSVLKKRVMPRIWILLPGDDPRELDRTVRTLTQGTRNRVDVDRLCEFLDDPDNDAVYLKEWRDRRGKAGYLLRMLDVRLFEVPPNVALGVVRAFGDESLKETLKQRSYGKENAIKTLFKTRFFQCLLGEEAATGGSARRISQETAAEYLRIQATAKSNDKPLNKALAAVVDAALKSEGVTATVTSEKKKLPGSTLQPDIQIEMEDDIYCLEPTWRRSPGTVNGGKSQNTLTPGHIQLYILNKVIQYVKDLGL